MSDRLLILSEGQLMARLEREDFKQTTVLHYASGEKE
jgi:ABC-type sugar transport system ATPase subunit